MHEPDADVDGLAAIVVDAALSVHRGLGPGFLEAAYQRALALELEARGVGFEQQVALVVSYRGHAISEYRLDFLVGGRLVVELKAVDQLLPLHAAQLRAYLRASGCLLGLLINFNVPYLREGLKRVIQR